MSAALKYGGHTLSIDMSAALRYSGTHLHVGSFEVWWAHIDMSAALRYGVLFAR